MDKKIKYILDMELCKEGIKTNVEKQNDRKIFIKIMAEILETSDEDERNALLNKAISLAFSPIRTFIYVAEDLLDFLSTEEFVGYLLKSVKNAVKITKSSILEIADKYLEYDDKDIMPWVKDEIKRKKFDEATKKIVEENFDFDILKEGTEEDWKKLLKEKGLI